ncbi:DUF177 domain-containing protein [candidate division WOR-3 bacterium]|nr:DUF177 domain-containing protein [candidate division WOR-3 bacterium]
MIPVHEIADTYRVEYDHISAGELELKHPMIEKVDHIEAQVGLRASAIGIIADFHITYSATFSCVRCLDIFETTCHADLSLNYVTGVDPHAHAENVDLSRIDINKTYYSGPYIDLKIGIREAILLYLPIAPLCREDCAGLCPKCGANKNRKQCACVIDAGGVFTSVIIPDRDKKMRKKRKEGKKTR